MFKNYGWKKAFLHLSVVSVAIVPPIIYSYEYGPDPGFTGAPGDNPTGCIASGCHVTKGTAGSIKIAAVSGLTYTPGQAQQIQVTIADPAKHKYGFELTARDSNNNAAGTFSPTDANTQVVACKTPGVLPYQTSCPSGNAYQWIEHNMTGYANSKGSSYTYSFSWTPPATSVGVITLYAAGNAGTGGLQVTDTNTYLTSIQLSPADAGGPAPTISAGGIVPDASSAQTIQPGEWVSIYGSNLITGMTPANWDGTYPTTLGGTSVTINGKSAYLSYASNGQINLQAPDDTTSGTVNVAIKTANGTGTATVTLASVSPAFLLLDATHAVGIILRPNGSGAYGGGSYDILGPTGSSLGYPTVAAKAGDSVVLFGTGFGPTSPFVPAGKAYSGAAAAVDPVTITIHDTTLAPCGSGSPCAFAGLSEPGLYQFNLTIPSGLGSGDHPLSAVVNGTSTQKNIVISLQ